MGDHGFDTSDAYFDIEEDWAAVINKVLDPVRELRGGDPVREFHAGSICTGTSAEGRGSKHVKMPTKWYFYSDSKEAAFNFVNDNNDPAEHYFVDCYDLMDDNQDEEHEPTPNLKGRCAYHGWQWCALLIPALLLDMFIAGISCKPFSVSRSGRHEGTSTHEEANLVWVFLKILFKIQPRYACLENVWGFVIAESTKDPVSPLQNMLNFAVQEGLPFFIRIFVLCGSTFNRWRRRRIFVSFHHNAAGGEASSLLQEAMVKARPHI